MSAFDIEHSDLPRSDLAEAIYRLVHIRSKLEEVSDDFDRQEVYDLIGYQTVLLCDVIGDLRAMERVLREVCG